DDFLAAAALCDVMLDTVHFGGGKTSSEALGLGVPVVTLPSAFLRGRLTRGYYRKLGIRECVVSTPQQYVDLAVELGTNSDRREELRKTILSRSEILFDNSAGVRELEEFFEREVDRLRRCG